MRVFLCVVGGGYGMSVDPLLFLHDRGWKARQALGPVSLAAVSNAWTKMLRGMAGDSDLEMPFRGSPRI